MLADFLMATSGVWHQLLYCLSPLTLTFIYAYLRKPSKGFLRGFTIAGVLDLGEKGLLMAWIRNYQTS